MPLKSILSEALELAMKAFRVFSSGVIMGHVVLSAFMKNVVTSVTTLEQFTTPV